MSIAMKVPVRPTPALYVYEGCKCVSGVVHVYVNACVGGC